MATAETPNQNYLEELATDAAHWLDVVGQYDHEVPKPENTYNRSVNKVVRHLGSKFAEADYDTTALLATLEREAQLHTSSTEWISDEETQNTVRTNQVYMLARVLNEYAGFPTR